MAGIVHFSQFFRYMEMTEHEFLRSLGQTAGRRLARSIEAKLRSQLHLRVPVAISAPGTLPRFEMKAQRWVRIATPSGEG